MVQPYPTAAQMPEGAQQQPVPGSVRNAVVAMYAGAALSVIHAILYIVTESSTRAAYASKHPHLTAHQITTGAHALEYAGVVDGVVAAVLFIWMAQMCRRGRNWARITSTVFFGLGVLGALGGLVLAVAAVDKIFTFLVVLPGLAAVILLWQSSSSAYFDSSAKPR